MKTIGIQIKSTEAIVVVLEKDDNGNLHQTNECVKFNINDTNNPTQIKQFRDQINSAFDSIRPSSIAILARNPKAKGTMAPSPISFKLEGIIQLYDKMDVQIIWPATLLAYYKKHPLAKKANLKYQDDAFELALYLISK